MLTIQEQVSLQSLNTLGIDAKADYYIEVVSPSDIPVCLAFAESHKLSVLVLGGGSNIVLQDDFRGLVIKVKLQGIQVAKQGEEVIVTAAAGENWHELVSWCLQQGYYGLENLALIPGSVGAAPIQNIGAYGVELMERFERLSGWDCDQKMWRTLGPEACDFSYRHSIFKGALKNRFIITEVSLRLSTIPTVTTHYEALFNRMTEKNITEPTPQQVAETVIQIRQSKLPDPVQLANAGSFFKNTIVSAQQLQTLLQDHPDMVYYPQKNGSAKLAAGWLLEKAGWKGRREGAVGMHEHQALVLVNYEGALGSEVLAFAQSIQRDIQQKFGVSLDIEPAIVSSQST